MTATRPRRLRRNATDAERALWNALRDRQLGGCKFRRQHPLGLYVVDFVCLSRRLIVEADGGQHALRAERDDERTAWLEAQGFRVVRFWNNEVLGEIEGVKQAIFEALERPRPPSP